MVHTRISDKEPEAVLVGLVACGLLVYLNYTVDQVMACSIARALSDTIASNIQYK